ncbi:MAG: Signal transduction histidine kinase [Parcubacteria group bacterium GW2011_GWA1_49_11]|nr:MAG: Signal transduction histidine kinase [Parcubacteria group bacterium GW2011_GWA1_49_11]
MEKENSNSDFRNKKILLIEDESFLADLLAHYIEGQGASLELASTGEEGLLKADSVRPDIILLDILLPGIDGYEVLKQLKANPELSKIPVVFLSNLGGQEEIERGLKLGAADYLVKSSLVMEDIIKKIKKILQ